LSDEQLEAAVRMELDNSDARNCIFKILNSQPQDQMTLVKVIVINDDDFTRQLRFLQKAGLETIWSGLRTRGIQNFLNFHRDFWQDQPAAMAYLDLNAQKTEFGVIQGEEIIYQRNFTPGTLQLAQESTDLIADFLEEVRLSAASFHAETKLQLPESIWLLGQATWSDNFCNSLLDHGYQVLIPKRSRLNGVLISESEFPVIAPLLGLALDECGCYRQKGYRIYSASQNAAKLKQRYYLTIAKVLVISAFFVMGIFLGIQAGFEKKQRVQQWIAKNSSLFTHLQGTEAATNRTLGRIRVLDNWLADRDRELEFLRSFQAVLPESTKINDLIIEEGTVKDISGVTPAVSVLLDRLHATPGLKKLKLKGVISVTAQGELFHLEGPLLEERPK
jgi:hypothetical protein